LGPFAVRVAEVSVAPRAPARALTSSAADVVHLGVDAEARPIVVEAGGVVRVLRGSTLERRRLFAGPGDPVFLGRVHAARPRRGGGAWLAADAGLFIVDTQYVLPLAADVGPLVDVREVPEGPLSGLWLVSPSSLLLVLEEETAQFTIPDLLGPQAALAVDPGGRRALLLAGPEALVLEPSGLDLDVYGLAFDAGTPRAAAATRRGLWLATERGLFRLPVEGPVDAWARVDLADGPILATALDADASEVHVLDAAGRVLSLAVTGEGVAGEVLEVPAARALVADGRGGVWTAAPEAGRLRLEGRRLDAAPTFARDVRPFVEAHCAGCHARPGADFRTYDAFAPRAEAALARVASGDMPRCEDDTRCPEDRQLRPETYAVLERWIEEGKLR
jgi:hypothetical protein